MRHTHRQHERTRADRPGRSAGFSLVELLVAIAILGVGLAMAAALFPTAIKQNEFSFNDTLGMIICKNALATVKAKATYEDLSSVDDATLVNLGTKHPDYAGKETYLDLLTEADLTYPVPRQPPADFDGGVNEPTDWVEFPGATSPWDYRPASTRGAVVLARRMGAGNENDFQFVIVAYRKEAYHPATGATPQQNIVAAEPIDDIRIVNQDENDYSELYAVGGGIDEMDLAKIQRGSAVILLDGDDCQFVRIVRIPQETPDRHIVLDRIVEISGSSQTFDHAWFIVEQNTASGASTPDELYPGRRSPTLNVLVARSALRKTQP